MISTETTPIWDEMIAEKPDTLDIPCAVALTYEEVVQHATAPKVEPTDG